MCVESLSEFGSIATNICVHGSEWGEVTVSTHHSPPNIGLGGSNNFYMIT